MSFLTKQRHNRDYYNGVAKIDPDKDIIISILKSGPKTLSEISKELDKYKQSIHKQLIRREKAGYIKRSKQRNPKCGRGQQKERVYWALSDLLNH